jgi:hypothetical protein
MSRFEGDFAKLGLLQANLAKLARVPSQVAGDASEGIRSEIEAEFEGGHDPYGKSWEALAESTIARGRRPPPLTDSGDMAAVDVHPTSGAGIAIEFGPEYSGFHQTGTKNMPARKPLPEAGFPTSWSKAIADAATARVEKAMR